MMVWLHRHDVNLLHAYILGKKKSLTSMTIIIKTAWKILICICRGNFFLCVLTCMAIFLTIINVTLHFVHGNLYFYGTENLPILPWKFYFSIHGKFNFKHTSHIFLLFIFWHGIFTFMDNGKYSLYNMTSFHCFLDHGTFHCFSTMAHFTFELSHGKFTFILPMKFTSTYIASLI